MLNNFRNIQSLFWSHGSHWLLFRAGYALRRRTGLLRLQMPAYAWKDRPLETWLKNGIPAAAEAYSAWRKQNSPAFFFDKIPLPERIPWNHQAARDEAEQILAGEIKYFSHTFYPIGFPPDWHRDPRTGITLNPGKHWSELSDEGGTDIKFIWEPSRFGMVYTLVRAYASARDERYAEAFWTLIHSWAESNPPNTGPNWMDGQEAALRLLAWCFGFQAFLDAPSTTPARIAQFVVMVAAHAERIHRNIAFAISTHSNHAISEAAGLWLIGLLFPELRNSEKYRSVGMELLEREAAAQIFPDGTYSMYSLNYHRFILHIYLYVLRLAELNRSPLSGLVFDRVSASIDYLSTLIDPSTGQMPVYGSNDGALVLPLNSCDFTDYRPLLQLGSYVVKKKFLFEPGPWDEDIFWLYGENSLSTRERAGVRQDSQSSFPHGGIYLLRGPGSQALIRCTDHRTRPSHADQLHVDLWIRGRNIACDAGTYLYSGQGVWRNGLAHTAVHNTVTVDRLDQMKLLTRFTWTDWSKGKVLRQEEGIWQGGHDGYKRLPDPVRHDRTVIALAGDRWLIVDHLSASRPHHYALHWLLCDGEYGIEERAPGFGLWWSPLPGMPSDSKIIVKTGVLEGSGDFTVVRADPHSTRGWRSLYYGDKEPAISLMLETDRPSAVLWSYFGFEPDSIEVTGKTLKIRAEKWNTEVSLDTINR